MRNEQEFKALVMQKVHQQQDQKRRRLQKIRAVTATLSAVALVICGVAAVTLFIRANPTVDYGAQDGPYGGNKGNWFFSLFNRGSVDEEDSSWGSSASIEGTEDDDYSYNTDIGEGNTASDSDADAPGEEADGSVGSAVGGTTSDSPQNTDKNSDGAEGSANTEEDLPNCGGSVQNDSADSSEGYLPNSGSSNTECTPIRLTLEDLTKNNATMLALEGGYTEDPLATSKLFDAINNCLDTATPALIEPGELLFTIRNGPQDGGRFQIYDNNILVLLDNDSSVSYEITPAALQALLRTLQATEFSPID